MSAYFLRAEFKRGCFVSVLWSLLPEGMIWFFSFTIRVSRFRVSLYNNTVLNGGGCTVGHSVSNNHVRFSAPLLGSQNLGYSLHKVETGQRIQQGAMPVSDETFVSWIGFSEGGIPAFYDDKGVMHVLNYYRRMGQGQWAPILDTKLIFSESESDPHPHYWPVGLTDQAMTCVRCKVKKHIPAYVLAAGSIAAVHS